MTVVSRGERPGLLRGTVVLALVTLVPASTRAQDASEACRNEAARDLVRLARLRLRTVDPRIEAYSTTARERFSAGLRAGVVEKLVYRRETVTRIDWQRDGPVQLEVLALREVAPLLKAQAEVPFDMSAELLRLAVDPANPAMMLRVDSTALPHPLAAGSEAHYRFEAGDTTTIRLPDGRSVELHELRIIPRRRDPQLINGSFWLDARTHGVVQAYFRLARAFDVDRDAAGVVAEREPDSAGRRRSFSLRDIPFVRPIRAELDFIAIEYGLWELTWWLPRLIAARGVVQIGGFRIPLTYERKYDAYAVRGDTAGAPIERPDSLPRRCRENVRYTDPVRDSVRQARTDAERTRRERRAIAGVGDCTREFVITAAADSALLHSPELPPTPYASDMELVTQDELRMILEGVRSVPGAPWRFQLPRLQWGLLKGPWVFRYNRVEGPSLGARLLFELGPADVSTEARIGLADGEPRGAVALERREGRVYSRFAAYRRLQPTPPSVGTGTRATLSALLLGRDDADYYDAIGGELVVAPHASQPQWYELRLHAERQRAVGTNTDFSIPHLFDSDHTFRDNFTADAADQIGARLRLRTSLGLNPAAPRLAGELSLGAETGDYRIVRPEALATLRVPLPFRLHVGLEGAAGTVEGTTIPAQARWRLGGAATLRGYPAIALVGERYWRTRAELEWGVQAVRLSLFSDAGWAGPRNRLETKGALVSAGIGISQFDGLFRIDFARGFEAPGGWRLHLQFDGRR